LQEGSGARVIGPLIFRRRNPTIDFSQAFVVPVRMMAYRPGARLLARLIELRFDFHLLFLMVFSLLSFSSRVFSKLLALQQQCFAPSLSCLLKSLSLNNLFSVQLV
jgi:hypothetical protein